MGYLQPNYKNDSVPVYCSEQNNKKVLAISHFHEGIEFIRVTAGKVSVTIDCERYSGSKGDVFFIPQNAIHGVTSEIANAKICGTVFKLSAIMQTSLSVDAILDKNKIKTYCFTSGTPLNDELNRLLLSVAEMYKTDSVTYELEMRALLCEIVTVMVKRFYTGVNETKKISRLQPAINYINENYALPISVSDLSGKLYICNDHFIRLFVSQVGTTPTKFINSVRLKAAQKLLIGTDKTVTEIAYETGFSNANYMIKLFKNTFGRTPLRYRKSCDDYK